MLRRSIVRARCYLQAAWLVSVIASGACAREGVRRLGGGDEPDGGVPGTCDPAVSAANLDCGEPDVKRALQLLRAMSLEEKVQQMSGPPYNPSNFFDQEDNERLNIPGSLYMDGPRGVRWYNSDYGTTVYPVAAARAASWNLELEERIGRACAAEMRYLGRHVLLAPTINQVMHPRWGRAQETYGEDSFLLGEMGAAFVKGAQHDPGDETYRVQACVKHYAANNIEDTRIYVNAQLDERTLHEVYLPHFKKAVDAGVACVMAAYNRVNGSYSCYSRQLIRNILKGEWGYRGYVITDWFAKGNTLTSPEAGLDVEMPFSSGTFPSLFDSAYFYGSALSSAVRNAQVGEDLIDESVMRILYQKVHAGVLDHDVEWTPWLTKSQETRELALEAARQGIVLLHNGPSRALDDDVLPLDATALSKIAVVGKFANSENMGDKGSSDAKVVDGELVFTPFEGIAEAFSGDGKVVVAYETVQGNEAELADADVVVVVGAYYYADLARSSSGEEGEWKDRQSLDLPDRDLANISAAVALKDDNPELKIVVQLKSGGAVVVDDWLDDVDAVIMSWYAGMSEGIALAEILFGEVNPSGKLCQSVPVDESDLPKFANTDVGTVEYNYYHGYRWLDKEGIAPRYAFGYGLSYTTFAYGNLIIEDSSISESGTLLVSVEVTNTGPVAGSEVVQLYVGYDDTAMTSGWGRPVKELKAFARVADLAPEETRTVQLEVDASELAYWDPEVDKWVVEKMEYQLYVGPSSDARDANMQRALFTVN